MPKRKDTEAAVDAIDKLATDLIDPLQELVVHKYPILQHDMRGQAMALVNLGVATLFRQPMCRNPHSLEHLVDFLKAAGEEILASIEKNGIKNPPNPVPSRAEKLRKMN